MLPPLQINFCVTWKLSSFKTTPQLQHLSCSLVLNRPINHQITFRHWFYKLTKMVKKQSNTRKSRAQKMAVDIGYCIFQSKVVIFSDLGKKLRCHFGTSTGISTYMVADTLMTGQQMMVKFNVKSQSWLEGKQWHVFHLTCSQNSTEIHHSQKYIQINHPFSNQLK